MADPPKLSRAQVGAFVGEREVEKGRPYAQRGALLHLRCQENSRQENVLKADCLGTAARPYHVEVTLSETDIQSARCSCPVGLGCKHIAALLLTWVDFPELFATPQPLEAHLETRSKEELIALLLKLVARAPDLELLVQASSPNAPPLNAEAVRAQAKGVIERLAGWDDYGGRDSYARSGYDSDAEGLTDLAESYLEAGDLNSAATAFQSIAAEAMENYEYDDEEGTLAGVAQRCAEGLGRCLARAGGSNPHDPNLREIILSAMVELFCDDLELGGYGIGDSVPGDILEHATQGEKQQVVAWLRDALPKGGGFGKDFLRRALGKLMLELQADTLNDESFLALSRETGRTAEVVEKLLTLRRLDDAVREAEAADDYTLLELTGLFERAGARSSAYDLVFARSQTEDDPRLLRWLLAHYEATGSPAQALEVAQTLFWRRPSLEGYGEVRGLAERTSSWGEVREQLLTRLRSENNHELLTELYRSEGDTKAMLASFEQLGKTHPHRGSKFTLAVAGAAEATHPDDAIRLYQGCAEGLIGARGRSNYQEAARLLGRVAALYDRQDRFDVWETYLSGLRQTHKKLRALQEELDRAGL